MPTLSWGEIETNAIAFAKRWKDCRGDERQDAQTFEKDLMSVFGVDWLEGLHERRITNEYGVQNYIDYILPGKILIEMKSKGESLIRAYNQAIVYSKCLKPEEHPEIIMVSDFEYIQVTNLRTGQAFQKFKLNQLKKHIRMFGVVAGYTSEVTFKTDIEVNTDASYKMAKLHDGLKANGYVGKELEIYLVRLLFCLFAEDTGIFEKNTFENYILASKEDGSDLSGRMMELFSILDTPEQKRMGTLREELKRFRYINGNLFAAFLPPAAFDVKMRQTLIDCCDFDWSFISPAIFGAMFQGVMDEKERRELGAHYTSEKNILKVIQPLFLDDLWAEFDRMKSTKAELEAFHDKIASLRFLDPACGCGNFLIITYRELRLLEFEVLKMLHDNTQMIIMDLLCKVSVDQFYGIEYEEFPCQIAQVGLLLMKHQMDKEVSNYFGMNLIDFPIKETATIVHGNALQIDWETVVPKDKLSYCFGNPPLSIVHRMCNIWRRRISIFYAKGKCIKTNINSSIYIPA
ncbi:MAG: class I SAM-dependent DNA methyltransferase [Trichococcus flocculiformis]|uniref:site-specific DNA-methyltransferase (adenine-specific) n=1 Tax=Trichococcus flocculiformis TaxID=82803 RepID=A0A847D9K9_9LACT|nr:DNA methyltransferase [Trichococcus flocculiformis]NLD33190.1 class I SAM-dependent DNA methyltransferase [Trichococcus flocculiformis]